MPIAPDVTQLLTRLNENDDQAMNQLIPIIYDELRRMAHSKLRWEASGSTLNTTALVHEAYFKLADQKATNWQNRNHFFAIAAQAMRRIILNNAEKKQAKKRGGNQADLDVDEVADWLSDTQSEEILALDEALEQLKSFDERGYNVVVYRFYGGLNYEEIAAVMDLSHITVRRSWNAAKLWLNRSLRTSLLG
ncbi:MAG: sigma-70 family RNA polymerase sigma factor [Rhodothermia bacterium]|nr:sigma-70 family RNA polymerase sigma factor [Rhodothermia bacterium]